MPKKSSLAQYNKIVKSISQLVVKQAKAATRAKWSFAYIDMRTPGGRSCMYKFRIELADGAIINSVKTPDGVGELFVKLLAIKDDILDRKWFGIKIVCFSDKKFEIEYNYDANCVNDPTFFEKK